MVWLILFVFGLVIGSFLNVVTMRYDGEHLLFDHTMIGGRSHCSHCGRTLRWFELVPLISFIMLGGHCARCKAPLSLQYPIVELVSGLIFVLVPYHALVLLGGIGIFPFGFAAFWVVTFEALLIMSIIDIRLGIIPDELNVFLFILGIFFAIFMAGYLGLANHSLINFYSGLFGLQQNLWLNHVVAALLGAAFFGLLILVTRGKGMGMGDLKLAVPLGFIFGWPDILIIVALANVVGAVVGLVAILSRKKSMKSTLPFGPFLATGAALTFFFAYQIFQWYFTVIGLR